MQMLTQTNGGLRAAVPFREVWCIDFEFHAPDGERPRPICLAATEVFSGEQRRAWRDELRLLPAAPFDVGADVLVVCYYAPAEMGCFLSLNWPLPHHVVDFHAEHRAQTNSFLRVDNSLISALLMRGLPAPDASAKEFARDLILRRVSFSAAEREQIEHYNQSDADATATLLAGMAPTIDWPRALLRGRYTKAVAAMERDGVPIDKPIHDLLEAKWPTIKSRLVEEVDRPFGVYRGTTFKEARFVELLTSLGIPWRRLESGRLDLKDETFKERAQLYPLLEPLKELRETLNRMRLSELGVGADGRNRVMLSPFASLTGRNQPSNKKFVFGPAKWFRSLIKPPPIDWSAQENALAAALSGDELMMESYRSLTRTWPGPNSPAWRRGTRRRPATRPSATGARRSSSASTTASVPRPWRPRSAQRSTRHAS
jgi:hypothetical protein